MDPTDREGALIRKPVVLRRPSFRQTLSKRNKITPIYEDLYEDLDELEKNPPTRTQYLHALQSVWNFEKRVAVERILNTILLLGGAGTSTEIAKKTTGISDKISVHGSFGKLGHHVAEALGVPKKGRHGWWNTLADGRPIAGGYLWTLRSSFLEALRAFPQTASLPGWEDYERIVAEQSSGPA